MVVTVLSGNNDCHPVAQTCEDQRGGLSAKKEGRTRTVSRGAMRPWLASWKLGLLSEYLFHFTDLTLHFAASSISGAAIFHPPISGGAADRFLNLPFGFVSAALDPIFATGVHQIRYRLLIEKWLPRS